MDDIEGTFLQNKRFRSIVGGADFLTEKSPSKISPKIWYIDLYPVLIFQTRYGGMYERGNWAAIANCTSVPEEAIGDDTTCSEWWASDNSKFVGVGMSPDDAYLNMLERYDYYDMLDY